MVRGRLRIEEESVGSSTMSPYMPGLSMGPLPTMTEHAVSGPFWEEKTGEKSGFIFKREGRRRLKLEGLRCALCGYIELYAREED